VAEMGPGSGTEAIRERTAQLAYAIWEREGCPHGRDREHWMMAEAELMGAAEAPAAEAAAGATETASKPAARPAAKPRAAQAEAQL
jgi:hypothetical protein